MDKYQEYLDRKRRQYQNFDEGQLSQQFVRYYNSGERIRIATPGDDVITGTIGVTTGWRPAFLLMRRSNSQGSCDLLADTDTVLAVKHGRHYQDIAS